MIMWCSFRIGKTKEKSGTIPRSCTFLIMRISARGLHTTGVSTLLLPVDVIRLLNRRLDGSSMSALIHNLIGDGVPTIRPGCLRIRYQKAGLDLIRRDFRIEKEVWFRLGQMARAYGVSRCLLFVALLRAFSKRATEFRQGFVKTWRLIETFESTRCERIAHLDRRPGYPADAELRSRNLLHDA